jgi:hypothetical protein
VDPPLEQDRQGIESGSSTNLANPIYNLQVQALDGNSIEETHNESRSGKLQIATKSTKPTRNLAQASIKIQKQLQIVNFTDE